MTLKEIKEREYLEQKERKQKEQQEITQYLQESLSNENIKVFNIRENSEDYSLYIDLEFTLDGYTQKDTFLWDASKSIEDFIKGAKNRIDYIKELREQYPDFCKANDFIQTNSVFVKTLKITHMGYDKRYDFRVDLADYLKLPNTTSCSVGGGDYEIKRTPRRVKEYNENIDITVDFLLECITELRNRKYK